MVPGGRRAAGNPPSKMHRRRSSMNLTYAANDNRTPRFGVLVRPATAAWAISLAMHAIAGVVFWQHLSNAVPVPRESLMLRASIRQIASPAAPADLATPASALGDNAQSAARSRTRPVPRSTPLTPVRALAAPAPTQYPVVTANVATAAATLAPVDTATAEQSSVAPVGAALSSAVAVAVAVAAVPAKPAAPQVARASPHQHAGGHVDVKYLHTPKPDYPPAARRRGLEGTVLLRVLVNPEGAAGETRLIGPSGTDSLDQAALAAVQRWRFVPAREGAVAIAHWVDIPITFRLDGTQ